MADVKISDLSTKTGVSARSLRYYEQQGLITAVRRPNGYRDYDDEAVATVLTIRSLLDLGFPSELIRTVMPCTKGDTDQAVCEGVVERVTAIRDEMAQRVVQMEQTRDTLTRYLTEQSAGLPPVVPAK
ncbi:MerR family transcriptional regulator [Kineosporia sp. NBRC 101731]|uniref:MerR family transcriptional regulator n=1 Tax=Kineosporia sp. NBRC 101731 TaxID=3032199 RepID=UPI0024A32484|nr:MerR family transcriptional regulator [Kineosporia sp. NBRC 101731]GLY27251.1 MerR family transcriptional regulator [Kineosporia sp. NBRC 101731]